MSLPKEKIEELKKEHPGFFKQRRTIITGEDADQRIAGILLSQLQHDKQNPPEAAARVRVQDAASVVRLNVQRLERSSAELHRILDAVCEQFPDLDLSGIEIVLVPAGDEATTKMIQDLREQLQQGEEAMTAMDARAERDSNVLAGLRTELKEAKAREENMSKAFTDAETVHLANLNAAQELLKQVAGCASIKDVRELLKPAEPQQPNTSTQTAS